MSFTTKRVKIHERNIFVVCRVKGPTFLQRYLMLFLFVLSGAFLNTQSSAFAQIQQWDFQSPDEYKYDRKKMDLIDGIAQLTPRTPYRDAGSNAFDRGHFASNSWAARNAIEMIPQNLREIGGIGPAFPVHYRTPGLMALWHFDEPSGSNVLDEVGRNVAKVSDAEIVSGQTGFKYARLFDGMKSHVFVPYYHSLRFEGPFTLEAWVRPVATINSKPQTIISRWQTVAAQKSFALQLSVEGKIDFQVSPDGATTIHHRGDSVLTPGFWYHVAVVYTGADLRIYLNGALDSTPAAFTGNVFQSTNPIYLGALVSNRIDELFEGVIDEVAFYNRALGAVDAMTHYGNPTGLVGLWHLNERGGILADRSGYEHNIVAYGDATYETEGKFATAVYVNGKKQYLETPASYQLGPDGAMSFSAWINPDKLPSKKNEFTLFASVGGETSYSLSLLSDGRIVARAPSLSPGELSSHTTVMPNVWQHVTVTWGNGVSRVYINGLLDGSVEYGGFLRTGKVALRIGLDDQKAYPFLGSFDEISVYRRVLMPTEISRAAGLFPGQGIYESAIKDAGSATPWQSISWGEEMAYGEGISIEQRGLIHLYPLDEKEPEITLMDDAFGEIDMNAVGSYSVPGKFGGARWFSEKGYDKLISQKQIPSLSTFTLSFWFQFATGEPGLSDRVFSIGDENPSLYRAAPGGKLYLMMTGSRKLTSATPIRDTEWHHVAVTSDGNQLFLFIDGVLDAHAPVSGATGHEPLVLGNLKTSDTFRGAIDDFAIINYALEQEDIINTFLAGKVDLKFLVRTGDDSKFTNTPWVGPKGNNRIQREVGGATVGLWHFTDHRLFEKMNEVTDASRFENHGLLYGHVQKISGGVVGGAVELNGAGDFIEIPDRESLHLTDQLTLSAWIKPAAIEAQGARILDKRYKNGVPVFSSFSLELAKGNRLALRLGRPGGYHVVTTDRDGEIATGRWNHVAATYDRHQVKLYINGELRKAMPFRDAIPYDDGALYIGRYGNGDSGYFWGAIDEVGIDAVAFSDHEIRALFLKADPENYYTNPLSSKLQIPTGRYFQYQTHLISEYPYVSPAVQWVEVVGSSYAADSPFVINEAAVSFADISQFRERTGPGHQGGTTYQISNDGHNWFYHNGRHWVIAVGKEESNTADQIGARIKSFAGDVGIGSFYFKAFLHSTTGLDVAELESVAIDYLPNKLTLSTPNGAEAWLVGTDQQIRWNSAGEISKVRLEYSKDGFKEDFYTIVNDLPNEGNFTWSVPDDISPQVKIRVSDSLDPRIHDTSDISFRVVGALEVVAPNWQERWQAGTEQEIVWRTLGSIPNVKLEYSTDNFQDQIFPVVDSVKNEGRYHWLVPDHLSANVRVRVSDLRDPLVSDHSNDIFSIHGDLNLVFPEEHARLVVGQDAPIRWEVIGTIPTVTIEYALIVEGEDPEGETPEWRVIEELYSNRGTYLWKVPDEIYPDIRLRIMDPNDSEVFAVGSPFAIVGGLSLLNPQGGEMWTVGSRRKIAWRAYGTIPNVTLEYALLDGLSEKVFSGDIHSVQADLEWEMIEPSLPNIGSYIWEVPDALSDVAVLRVTDARDPFVASVQEKPFRMIPGFVLLMPNGGESLEVGAEEMIEWNTLGSIEQVRLEYSKDNFVTDIHPIIASASNIGRFAWVIPDDLSAQIWVRVLDPNQREASDTSDAPFRIFGSFDLIAPTGGEKFEVGSLATIQWETKGSVDHVRLEYSFDDFMRDARVIAQTLPNTGQFQWKVPDDIGSSYHLRISDVEDLEAHVVSKGPFSIVGNFHLVYPAGGDNVTVGTLLKISWKGASSVPVVRLDYSEDNFTKSFSTLAEGAANTGQFEWEVPNRIGQTFKIRIWDPADPASMYVMPTSSRIVGGFMLHSPNGGEALYVGEPVEIKWQSFGTMPRVRLEFSNDNFNKNIWEIADYYENVSAYQWLVPDAPSDVYKVRISDPRDPVAFDISNSDFRIRSKITVLSPKGGEGWKVGETQTIKWQTSGSVKEVLIEYSNDDFESTRTIAEVVPNTGIYEWVVPNYVSENLKIRISDIADPGAHSISLGAARIQGVLTLVSPNGDEVWKVGTQHPLAWISEGKIDAVRLEYSRDGFASEVKTIMASTSNSGVYNWTVPDDISPQAKIRVLDVDDNTVQDASDKTFQTIADFKVMGPNGGEVWHATEKREISWVTVGTVSEVNLSFCKVGSSNTSSQLGCGDNELISIDIGIYNSGRYIWDLPPRTGNNLRVQVCDAKYPSACDTTDGVFQIVPPFEIVYPRSRENWVIGREQEIRWHTYGEVYDVVVQYTTLSEPPSSDWNPQKALWETLVKELTNKGHFLFNVPDVRSKYVVFKVADWMDESLYSVSKEAVKFMGEISLISPNGGEAWAAGSSQPIVWDSTGSISNVRLEYSADNFVNDVKLIEPIYPNTGRFDWTLPAELSKSVKIRVMDESDADVYDRSDNFFKVMAGFILFSPNGGEKWVVGTKQRIRWKAIGNVNAVRLEYFVGKDETGLDRWRVIGDKIPNDSSYEWVVPNEITQGVKIRISDISDPDAFAVSRNQFEIKPDVVVTFPNGGEVAQVGKPIEIRWASIGSLGDVKIEYSKDNFKYDIHTIAAQVADRNLYIWLPSDDITTEARVRITSINDPEVADATDQPFKIVPQILMLSPVTDASWTVGSHQAITWDWRGTLDEVKIEYSLNGFDSAEVIVENYTNTGRYIFQVPDHLYKKIQFRVADAAHPEGFGVTTAEVKIIPGFTLLSPNGGEMWRIGEQQVIEWTTQGSNSRVNLDYRTYGGENDTTGVWKSIRQGERNKGRMIWTVADDVASFVKLRVSDSTEEHAFDESDKSFKILGDFKIVAPAHGEVLQVESRTLLTWDTVGNIQNVKLDYYASHDDYDPPVNAEFITIEPSLKDKGSYYWSVPDTVKEYVWLRISDVFNPDSFGLSAKPFKIRGRFELMLSEGRKNWQVGSVQTLNWKTTGSIPQVDLFYSIVNKTPWKLIAKAISNSGTYGWEIPHDVAQDVKLRIQSANNPNIFHETSDYFSIAAQFKITSPAAGETFKVGEESQIKWTTTGSVNKVWLEYSTTGEQWHAMTGPMPAVGSYLWSVPDRISSIARVRIYDGDNRDTDAVSEPFHIVGSVKLEEPAEGEVFKVGSVHTLKWESIGSIPQVRLEYLLEDQFAENAKEPLTLTIEEKLRNDGIYEWIVPDKISDRVRIRISDARDETVLDLSDKPISIIGDFDILSPKGGEKWIVGSSKEIVWSSKGSMDAVNLEYSRDDFYHDINYIGHDLPNTGLAIWSIPDAVSTRVKIRISDSKDPRASDISDEPIHILGALVMTTPGREEVWHVNEKKLLSWLTTGTIPTVRIEYSRDEFNTDIQVIENTYENSGRFEWRVPDIISSNLRVRVLDVENSSHQAMSYAIKIQGGLKITGPQSGQSLKVLGTYPITWVTTGTIPKVRLEYSRDSFDRDITRIAADLSNTGAYAWTVPDDVGSGLKLRISDELNGDVQDITPGFFDVEATLQFLDNFAVRRWAVGSKQKISWNTIGTIPRVRLEYSKDPYFSIPVLIADQLENRGQYIWTVPDDISDAVYLRVSDTQAPRVSTSTQDPTTIVGTLSLLAPKGREIAKVGDRMALHWDTVGTIPNVRLEYSAVHTEEGAERWKMISGSTQNVGGFTWEVPDDIAEFVKLRISDVQDPEVMTVSQVPFAIRGQMGVIQPRGGERWIVGIHHEILWQTTGSMDAVNLYYSRDNFKSEKNEIASGVANTGRYTWTVPDVISDHIQIRVVNVKNAAVSITSAPLAIIGDFVFLGLEDDVVWKVGSEQKIKWQTVGSIPEVRLEYYTPSLGTSANARFRRIQDKLPNQGEFLWLVPDQIGEGLKIRITDARYRAVSVMTSGSIKIEGVLEFTQPAGREQWQVGSVHKVEWKTSGSIPFIVLEYSWDDFQQNIFVMEGNYGNENYYFWTIPSAISEEITIRIRDSRDGRVADYSKPLKIHGKLDLLQPTGSQNFKVDEVRRLEWQTIGAIPSVRLEYSTDEFKESIYMIESAIDNIGQYHWNVPDHISDKVWLRISDTSNFEVHSVLEHPITIQGELQLIRPLGHKLLKVGQTETIEWQTSGTLPTVRVEYSNDKFVRNINVIEAEVTNTGRYDWVVPDFIFDKVELRVVDARDATVSSGSAVPFEIQGALELLSLAENRVLKVGQDHEFEWKSVGSVQQVRLEYSSDEFRSDIHVIHAAVPNRGAVLWSVPDIAGKNIRVRVFDVNHPEAVSYSKGLAHIQGDFQWLYPHGNEVWTVGDNKILQWKTNGTIDQVILEYSTDGFQQVVRSIEKLIVNEYQYTWKVPDHIGKEVHLRVRDAKDRGVSAVSEMFKITGTLDVIAPRRAAAYGVESEQRIEWKTTGTIPQVRLEYSFDAFRQDIRLIEKAVPASGGETEFYIWRVPNAISDQVWLRVSDARDLSLQGVTPSPFKIQGRLNLLEPLSAATWRVGTKHPITWETLGSIPYVRLEYSRDGFVRHKKSIAENIENQGMYAWTAPDEVNEQIWIRVLDASDETVYAMTGEPLRIQGGLLLREPVGGDEWTVGDEQLIKWETTGTIPQVRLEYLIHQARGDQAGEARYIKIQDRIPNRGSYPWRIPDHLPQFIKLRVVDVQNSEIFSETQAPIKLRAALKFLSPNQPQIWRVGSTQEIVWESKGFMPQVRLEYSRDDFKDEVGMVYDLVANAGMVKWVVPDVIAQNLKFRLSDPENADVSVTTQHAMEVIGDLKLKSPSGGEQWVVGTVNEIRWDSLGSMPFVKIGYSKDKFSRLTSLIAESAPNTGVFTWEIPDYISNNVWVRVSDVRDPRVQSISGLPFHLSGNLYMQKPNGGEIWTVRDEVEVVWDSLGSIEKVRLEYSVDDFFNSVPMTGVIKNKGSYPWLVPDVLTDSMKIKVIDAANSSVYSVSRMPVKIQGGFSFVSPEGPNFWTVGSQHVISWQTLGSIAYVNIEYSKDNFATASPIVLGVINTGSHNWMVPDVTADSIQFRVSNASDQSTYTITDAPIQIGGGLQLLNPGGGERWQVGENQEIRWRTVGTIPRVRLELSSDKFNRDIVTIVSSHDNSGFYPWKIPNVMNSGDNMRKPPTILNCVLEMS